MSLISGNGSSPEFSTSSIDTRIYGNPEEIRDAAAKVYELYDVLHDASYDMALPHAHYTEYYWSGMTANAYWEAINTFEKRTRDNANYIYEVWNALRAYAQQLDYHYRDMETIRTNALRCGLTIANDYDILAPEPAGTPPTAPPVTAPMRDQDLYRVELAEHQFQIQKAIDYDGLSRETQLVRDDLDDWVRKHLLNLQANPPKGFLSYLDESTHTYVERPWQTLVIAGDGGFALRAASRQNALEKSASDLAQLTKLPGIHQVRPYMDAKLSQYLESSAAARSAASHSSIATKVTTGLSTAVLAYDVATSDEPTKEAVSGGAAMYLGAAAGTFVGGLVTVASERPQAGVVAGTATSVVTENIAKSIIKVTYDQIPLEYRERIDNTLWHLPYYIGFDW